MFSVWFVGFLATIVYRVFYAGMNSNIFYRVSPYRSDEGKIIFNEGEAFSYTFFTIVVALTWVISVPIIGIFLLGQCFNKEK